MFGRNPLFPSLLDDPFFRDPFGQLDRMMRDPFMGSMLGPNLLNAQMHAPPPGPQQPRQATTIIEDVTGEEHEGADGDEPLVEEPEDDHLPAHHHHQRHHQHQHQQHHTQPAYHVQPAQPAGHQALSLFNAPIGGFNMMTSSNMGGGTVFMSSSSFTSVSGPGGVTYESRSQARMGPNGVMEAKKMERDGRRGRESVTVARGLGNQARTMVRERERSGEERRKEVLHNIEANETAQFDHRWMQAAESLPGWGAGAGIQQQINMGGHQPRLALPPSGANFAQFPQFSSQQLPGGFQQAGGYGQQQGGPYYGQQQGGTYYGQYQGC